MQTLLYSIAFALIVTFTEEILFSRPQSYFLTFLLDRRGPNLLPGLFSTIAALFLLVMLAWLVYGLTRRQRLLVLPFLIVPVMVETAYQNVFLRWFSVIDLKTALSSPPALWSSAFSLYFSRAMIVLVAVYLLLLFAPGRAHLDRPLFPAVSLAACLLGMLLCQSLANANWGTSIPQFYRTLAGWALSDTHPITRQPVLYTSPNPPDQNIVLIIDESIRADHLSLNGYARPTTPFLDRLAADTGQVYNWGTATSGATCSQLSNALLLTGIRPDPAHPGAASAQAQQYPTLFDYARAMGYQTYYLDAQTSYLWNGLGVEDAASLTGWLNTRALGTGLDRDQRAAEWIHQRVTTSKGNFIVLNKKGVHFIYEDSYPAGTGQWGPLPSDYHTQPELARNAYDNGILYNVNAFFEHLLPEGLANPYLTYYLYTSDHGQTLFEQGADWLHCNNTRLEASVPLLLIGQLSTPPPANVPASHASILPTLLDLMAVPAEARPHPYAPSLLATPTTPSAPRYFLSGSGQAIRYDQP